MRNVVHQTQLSLPGFPVGQAGAKSKKNHAKNKLDPSDRGFHDWYRFVLSFPPHLVRDYIEKFKLGPEHTILDPFCGTGTTLVESKLNGIRSVGLEANPFPRFASSVKLDWRVDPDLLREASEQAARSTSRLLRSRGIDDNAPMTSEPDDIPLKSLPPETTRLLLKNSISPLPLHKTLVLLDCLEEFKKVPFYNHMVLALGKALVFSISNLHFGPEVGVKKVKTDAPVLAPWLSEIKKMCTDLRGASGASHPSAAVHLADAREAGLFIEPASIDAVITSPPYPNEKDYTRTTRLESVLLGFFTDIKEMRTFKKTLLRSNTRGVYKGDDDDRWIRNIPEIGRISDEIEKRRVELGKTSGFEKLYGTVTRLYFGGMARHFSELRSVLRPGARLAYVVGDQASYLRVMIRTGKLLSEIARTLGYELVGIDLFRTRFATASKAELREEVVVLRWPG